LSEAQTFLKGVEDELQLFKFKLDLKTKLLRGATTEEQKTQYQADVDDANFNIRTIQADIGYARRSVQQWQNQLKFA